MRTTAKLLDICDFQGGTQPPKDEWISEPRDGYIRMLQIRDYTQGDEKFIEYVLDNGKLHKCNKDDIMLSRYGYIGQAFTGLAGAYNVALVKVIRKKEIETKYLLYYFKSRYFQNHLLENVGARATIPGFNKTELKNAIISIPDEKDQKHIANILERVEHIISLRQEQLSILDDLIKARFVEMFGDPISNPRGWPKSCIEDVVAKEKNALKAGPFGSALKKEYYVESGYKIYGQEQVISGDPNYGDYFISEEKYRELESCAVQAGDVLISLVGTYGKLLIMPSQFQPGIINPRLLKITFDKSKVNPYYFQHFFQSESLSNALGNNTHGGTMDILNLGIVRKIKMPLPPKSLQDEFVSFVAQVDKSKSVIQKSLDETQLLFDSLMQKYFG